MTRGNGSLTTETTIGRGFVDLAVAGDLDISSADTLRRLLQRLERVEVRLVCHLRGVGFIDSTGLEVLMEAARHRGGVHAAAGLYVSDTSRPVRRLLDLVGSHGTTVDHVAWDRFCASAGARRGAQPPFVERLVS